MTDVSIVRAVAYGLVGALLATIVAIAVLAGLSHPVPSILQEIAIGALGATAGLLAKTSTEPVPTSTTVTYGTPAISYVPTPSPSSTSSTTAFQPDHAGKAAAGGVARSRPLSRPVLPLSPLGRRDGALLRVLRRRRGGVHATRRRRAQ